MYFFIIIFKRNSWNRLFEVPFPVIQKKKIPSCKLPHKKSIQANFLICDTKINSSRNILWGLNPWGYGSIQKPYILFIGIRFSFQISLSLSVSSFLWVFLDIKKEVYSSHIEFLWAPAILINSLMFYMMFEFWVGTALETINSRNGILGWVGFRWDDLSCLFLSFGELWDPETSKAVDPLCQSLCDNVSWVHFPEGWALISSPFTGVSSSFLLWYPHCA